MSSALWLMHNNIMWRRFCAVVMWHAGPSSLCTTAVSLLLLSWIKNGRYWQFYFFFLCSGSRLGDVSWTEGKIAAVWLQTTILFTHSQGWWPLWWQVWRTSAGLDTHRTMVEGKKSVNCCPEAYFIYLESWWCVCSWLVFSILRDSNKSWKGHLSITHTPTPINLKCMFLDSVSM